MRTAPAYRLFLATLLGALATACDGGDAPFEPPAILDAADAALPAEPAALATARWADGYTFASNPTGASYVPTSIYSYNRSGGRITIRRPDATTGRYVVTFPGLSAVLGTKSTVHVSAYGEDLGYCKPMTGTLVTDKVEVRCFRIGTGTPLNTRFTVVVLGKRSDRFFAFAHQPTSTGYAPAGSGSYNPVGPMRVNRVSTGHYQVLFNNLATLPDWWGGHVQVNAVGSGKAYCKTSEEWGGDPNVSVTVQCYGPTGAVMDAKFTVLLQQPAAHLAYTYHHYIGGGTYEPSAFWTSNPASGKAKVERVVQGDFYVSWEGMDPEIIDGGTVHVTALGLYDNAYCKVKNVFVEGVSVRCFAANGTLVDVPFTVLLGS
jgi:hypothetical protein